MPNDEGPRNVQMTKSTRMGGWIDIRASSFIRHWSFRFVIVVIGVNSCDAHLYAIPCITTPLQRPSHVELSRVKSSARQRFRLG